MERIKALLGRNHKGVYIGRHETTHEYLRRIAEALEYPNDPSNLRQPLSHWERGSDIEAM